MMVDPAVSFIDIKQPKHEQAVVWKSVNLDFVFE